MELKKLLHKYWLFVLVALQPVLDLVAFFTGDGSGSVSGYIRLLIMAAMVVYLLISQYSNRRFIISLAVIAVLYGLHVINCLRVGYIDPIEDIKYLLKVAYMPVMALCFCCLITSSEDEKMVVQGLYLAFAIVTLVILVSYLTGSYTPTYDGPIGISGWVKDDNRCCHSDILSTLCVFAAYAGTKTKNKLLNILIPVLVAVLLFTNGTTACYYVLLAIMFGFPAFYIIKCVIRKEKILSRQILPFALMLFLFIAAIPAYRYSPKYANDHRESSYLVNVEQVFADEMKTNGYDIYSLSGEEIESDPVLKSCYQDYYLHRIYGSHPLLLETYGTDRIMKAMDYTVDSTVLEDTRVMKNLYARFIFEDSDMLTRLTGFEFSKIGDNKSYDLENDWFAIRYYYGWLGFFAYILLIVYFIIRLVRLLRTDFSSYLTMFNFALLLCFALQLGLGYFSGAMLRRPNASIYLSFVIALLYYRTNLNKVRSQ